MSHRYTTGLFLIALLPFVAVTTAADEKPAPKAEDKPSTPAKLERKNYTEKTVGYKVNVVDPDADPPKTKREEMKAQFDMVWIPGGEFMMGSSADEAGRDPNEGPQHKVKVGGFWMAKCEVTWDEFDLFWYDAKYLEIGRAHV